MRRIARYAPWLVIPLLLGLLFTGVARAQDIAPLDSSVAVDVGGWTYPLPAGDDAEPLVGYIKATIVNFSGSFAEIQYFALDPSGAYRPLTPCDDIAVTCQSVTTRMIGPLDGAVQGDGLLLTRGES